jgi:hypothetical protein
VDGGAHQRSPHRAAVQDQARQLLWSEAFESRPQSCVRVFGHLGLHADQVLDRVDGRQRRATLQQLPLEQGAV